MYYRTVAGFCVKPTIDLGCIRSARGDGYTIVELVIVLAIVGVLTAVAIPIYGGYSDRQDRRTAVTDIRVLETAVERFRTEFGSLPTSLNGVAEPGLVDPWGNPYEYLNIEDMEAGDKPRKDKNLVPLNSDFDLYSMGKDGESAIPLTVKISHDDIIRANDGAFVGLAIDY
jgi:general secretion pathway protein G